MEAHACLDDWELVTALANNPPCGEFRIGNEDHEILLYGLCHGLCFRYGVNVLFFESVVISD